MKIIVKRRSDTVYFEPYGELDFATADRLIKTIEDNTRAENRIILDLKFMRFMDLTGIKEVLNALHKQPISFKVVNINAYLLEILPKSYLYSKYF